MEKNIDRLELMYYTYHSNIPAIVSVGQKLLIGQPLGGAPGDRAEIYQ